MLPQVVVQYENSSDPMTLKIVQCELSIREVQGGKKKWKYIRGKRYTGPQKGFGHLSYTQNI